MRNLLFMLFVVAVSASCGGKSKKGAWTAGDKEKWMKECTPQMKGILKDDVAKNYCDCMLEQLEKKYSGYSEVSKKGSEAEGLELGQNCAHLILVGEMPAP